MRSDTKETISLDEIFGLSLRLFSDLFAAVVVDNTLHLVTEDSGTYTYTVYNADGSRTIQASATVKTLLNTIVGEYTISGSDVDLAVMMKIDDCLWTIANDNNPTQRYAKKIGDEISPLEVPSVFDQIIEEVSPWGETIDYAAGFDYTHSNGTTYSLIFYSDSSGESNGSIVKAWSKSSGETNYGEGSGVSFSTGESLYDTGVNVTAAFTTSDSIFIVTDSNTYHRFDLNQLPENILNALKAGSNSGSLSDLTLSDYLNTDKQHYRINGVDAALIGTGKVGTASGSLYLFCGTQYYRYSINNLAFTLDSNYPKTLSNNNEGFPQWTTVDAAFTSSETDGSGNPVSYLFNNAAQEYYRSDTEETLTTLGVWGAVSFTTLQSQQRVDAAYVAGGSLYLIVGTEYYQYTLLNQILFAGGIKELLQMSTQEINESPTISTQNSSPSNIQMGVGKFNTEPINTHLDFNSANGIYYWEVFFHAPFLIAQTLNTDQQFEYAKEWYEYIFDPTEVSDYWKFLPFLAVDPDALMATLGNDLDAFEAVSTEVAANNQETTIQTAKTALGLLAADLEPYQNIFLGKTDLDIYEADSKKNPQGLKLANIETWNTFQNLVTAISSLNTTTASNDSDKALLVTWKSEMEEVLEIIKKLEYRLGLMNNYSAQLAVYFADPFDPHAIATLRPIAYRKTIIMRYIDNLLDWGDMLFRQYTRESINEARMLYILAYDILGEKPENIGRVVLENTTSYNGFAQNEYYANSEDYDFLIELENSATNDNIRYEESLSFAATQFDTITNPYFYLKENELFTEYWTRVEDRLAKIRACLNIDGVAQPLPLFQPPIDPMALVGAVAGGASIAGAAAMAMGAASVPDYRFSSLMTKARDLVGKLKGLGDALLSALEKKDAEELSMLQNKQESVIQDMMTLIKEEQIKQAEVSLSNLEESKRSAEEQERHYTKLINNYLLPEEKTQIGLMGAAAGIHGLVVLSKIISGLSYVVPQFTAGPFSFGVTSGGRNVGAMLSEFGGSTESLAEGLSLGGEIAGIMAQFRRSQQDWELQKKMAISEIAQIDYQIAAQKHSITIAKQELLVHQKEMENQEAIAKFMKSKFSNLELYNWMI